MTVSVWKAGVSPEDTSYCLERIWAVTGEGGGPPLAAGGAPTTNKAEVHRTLNCAFCLPVYGAQSAAAEQCMGTIGTSHCVRAGSSGGNGNNFLNKVLALFDLALSLTSVPNASS